MDEDLDEMDLVNLLARNHRTMEPAALKSGVELLKSLRDQHQTIADRMTTVITRIDPANVVTNIEDN